MENWIDVAPVDAFEREIVHTLDYEGTSIAVIRMDSEFYAVANVCTHDYELMEEDDLEGEELVCPRHGARFCIRTGAALSPPAVEDLDTFPIKVEANLVMVCVDSLI